MAIWWSNRIDGVVVFFSRVSKTILFWATFVLTRPLGAVVGDFLDKPISSGGLDLSRFMASFVLLLAIVICVYWSTRNDRQSIKSV
jgi:Uncharacterized membrane-anchored protein conserved in bacteria